MSVLSVDRASAGNWTDPSIDDEQLVCREDSPVCEAPAPATASVPAAEPAIAPSTPPPAVTPPAAQPPKPVKPQGVSSAGSKSKSSQFSNQASKAGFNLADEAGIRRLQKEANVQTKDAKGNTVAGEFDAKGKAIAGPATRAQFTKRVTDLQTWLRKNGYDVGSYGAKKDGVDGVFGPKTAAAFAKAKADGKLKIASPISKIP